MDMNIHETPPLPRSRAPVLAGALLLLILFGLFQYLPNWVENDHSVKNARFQMLWKQTTQKQILASPVLVGNALIYGTYDGTLQAVSAKDGAKIWAIQLPDAIFSVTADAKGHVYASTGLHDSKTATLLAVEGVTGKTLWRQTFNGHMEAPPRIDEASGRLWISAGPGGLWALNTRDGATLWHKELGHIDAVPLLHAGVIYVPAQKSETVMETTFFALNADTGDVVWQLNQPGQPWAAPILHKSGKMVLTSTGIGQIGLHRDTDKGWAHAVSLDGKPVWQTALPNTNMNPDIYIPESDLVIYATKKGTLIALNAADGTAKWQTRLSAGVSAPAQLVKHFKETTVALTADDGVFYLVDAENGAILFSYASGEKARTTPFVHNGVIYITTNYSIIAISEKS